MFRRLLVGSSPRCGTSRRHAAVSGGDPPHRKRRWRQGQHAQILSFRFQLQGDVLGPRSPNKTSLFFLKAEDPMQMHRSLARNKTTFDPNALSYCSVETLVRHPGRCSDGARVRYCRYCRWLAEPQKGCRIPVTAWFYEARHAQRTHLRVAQLTNAQARILSSIPPLAM